MGTQTSKPLHGDEERRMRFRRPRTPQGQEEGAGSTSNLTYTTGSDTASDTHNNTFQRTWPCSNCHATVSNEESRCIYCGGIQVRIPRSPRSTTKAMIHSNLLLERLAATPTTPVTRKEVDPNKIQAFLSESATTSTMSFEEEEDSNNRNNDHEGISDKAQYQEELVQERPASALSQSSSISHSFNTPLVPQQQQQHLPSSPSFAATPHSTSPTTTDGNPTTNATSTRPSNPVALTLEAAQLRSGTPSPKIMYHHHDGAAAKRKAAKPAGGGFEVPKKKMVLNDYSMKE